MKLLDCKKCKKQTTHIRYSNQSNGETIFFGIFTLGLAVAGRQFWYECTACGRKVK